MCVRIIYLRLRVGPSNDLPELICQWMRKDTMIYVAENIIQKRIISSGNNKVRAHLLPLACHN